ncbi:inositol 2-dehydrogenase [Humitalea sp. 24SJ18S-53]|uniref:inositol 2-dehydrogenase n=1 Tax=Humitalea sp. 24SJ18S-53 TaxID=3422307 RepID=UPI003D66A5E2
MLQFALFGAGRIGAIHAANLAASGRATLRHVVDVHAPSAAALAVRFSASVSDVSVALADPAVQAVLIASSTDTHAGLAVAAARAGKAIFCEKPIDLSLSRVSECLAAVAEAGVPMMVGFNRRFDPDFVVLHRRVGEGAIGAVEQVVITSRDPGPPPVDYIKVSGGLFRDMTIHDFDMARWMLGEEPVEVFAMGANLVDPVIGAAGDIDSAMVLLKTASGRMATINNSRRASYGYDQRVEVHGSGGRLIAGNRIASTVEQADATGVVTEKPLHFFLERYAAAYRIELAAFIDAVEAGAPMPVGAEDGQRALILADAAERSMREGRAVRLP